MDWNKKPFLIFPCKKVNKLKLQEKSQFIYQVSSCSLLHSPRRRWVRRCIHFFLFCSIFTFFFWNSPRPKPRRKSWRNFHSERINGTEWGDYKYMISALSVTSGFLIHCEPSQFRVVYLRVLYSSNALGKKENQQLKREKGEITLQTKENR